jgi:hypothetical protein
VLPGFDGAVCRFDADDLAACGNDVNAGCAGATSLCAAFADAALFPAGGGICVAGCQVDADCGDAGLGCSHDLEFTTSDDPAPQGVCAPLTSPGSGCGRLGDGRLALCTTDTRCDRSRGESQGACVAR